MNKLFGKIMAFFLAASVVQIPVYAERTYDVQIGILEELNIMSRGDESEAVSRNEFAYELVKLFKITINSSKTNFRDLDDENYAAAKTLVNAKIMSGISDEEFAPNEAIRFCDAVTAMINVLGYRRYAEQKGGYAQGYMSVGSELKLTKNISYDSMYDTMTKKQLAELFYRAFEVPVLQLDFSDGKVSLKKDSDKTVLSEIWKIEKVTKKVTGVGFTGLDRVLSLKSDEIMLDGEIYKNRISELNQFLGCYVTAYLLETERGEKCVVAYEPQDKSSAVTLKDTDIDYYDDFVYTVGKKHYRIEHSADVIYNGIPIQNFEREDFIPQNGNVILTDSNGDGRYDVVQIFHAETRLVHSFDGEKLYFKNGTEINVQSFENVSISDNTGDKYSWDDLIEWDALSIGKSKDGRFAVCYVNHEKIGGYIDCIRTENGRDLYEIREREYRAASDCFYQNGIRPEVGNWIDFYMDYSGKIAAAVSRGASDYSYAWLIKCFQETDEDNVGFKIFDTRDATVKTVMANKKITVDGDKYSIDTQYDEILYELKKTYAMLKTDDGGIPDENTIKSYSSIGQPIRIAYNSVNKVIKIDTALKKLEEKDNTLHISPGTKTLSSRKARPETKSFDDNSICYTNQTLIVNIPENENSYNDYSLKFGKDLTYDAKLYGQMYSTTANSIADICVNYSGGSASAEFNGYSGICFVEETGVCVDEENDDKIMPFLTIFQNGGEKKLMVSDKTVSDEKAIAQDGTVIEAGDAVMMQVNSKNQITAIKMIYDCSAKKLTGDYRKKDEAMIRFGCLYEKNDNIIGLMEGKEISEGQDDKNSVMMYADAKGFEIIVSEKGKNGTYTAKNGNLSDMIDYRTSKTDYSRVIWHTWQGNPRGLIVYK